MAKTTPDLSGIDWTDAFINSAYIPDGDTFYDRWAVAAANFRDGTVGEVDIPYGPAQRQRLDLFRPNGATRGLLIFVHGGYWMGSGKSDWSHLSAGALARGWSVALPGYTLAPAARIGAITREIGAAIAAVSDMVEGPIRLTGHSAGGHLVTRMICDDSPLPDAVLGRIDRVVSISGVHDLRPLQLAEMNETLGLDPEEATTESPALRHVHPGVPVTAWVGASERPEFLRQAALLSEAWSTPGFPVPVVAEPGRHHFDVIDGLCDPDHSLTKALLED